MHYLVGYLTAGHALSGRISYWLDFGLFWGCINMMGYQLGLKFSLSRPGPLSNPENISPAVFVWLPGAKQSPIELDLTDPDLHCKVTSMGAWRSARRSGITT